MTLKQLECLITIDEDITDDQYGTYYDKRTVEQLLNYGLILLDKPAGPTSHEVVAWTKRILEISKALGVLLLGPKEYHALGRLHSLPSKEKLDNILNEFCGDIYQKPPQRSSVLRQTRIRKIFELELLEQKENLILIRVLCEAGTYIRKLIYDFGEVLVHGGTMIELRRTRVSQFHENHPLVTLHQIADAFADWKDNKDGSKLSTMIHPIEHALSEIKSVVIRDSAVDALCHGAQLAIPGVLQISPNLQKEDLVGVYTQKGEIVALAQSLMSEYDIKENTKGYAFETKRIIMAPETYPKSWKSRSTIKENITNV